MIGPTSPTESADRFARTISALEQRITDLELQLSRGSTGGRRNLFHNGQMAVNQRGMSTVAAGGGLTYNADRWGFVNNGIGAFDIIHTTYAGYGVGVPSGQPIPSTIQRLQCSAAEAVPGVNDYLIQYQAIEGAFLQHLNYGTASARPVTISFDAFSSTGGTFVTEIYQNVSGRSIGRAWTVPAGTPTHVVLTFPGDTVGTLADGTAAAVAVQTFVGAGSNWTSGTLGSTWGSYSSAQRASGCTNPVSGAVGRTWLTTNLQMEVALYATPYEVRPYSDELSDCMRYYQRHQYLKMVGVMSSGTNPGVARIGCVLPVIMRAAPTPTIINGPITIYDGSAAGSISSFSTNYSTTAMIECDTTSASIAANGSSIRAVTTYASGSWAIELRAEF